MESIEKYLNDEFFNQKMENLNSDEIEHNRRIGRHGLIVLVGGFSFLFGGIYLTKVSELESFSKANLYFYQEVQKAYQTQMEQIEKIPMQALFP